MSYWARNKRYGSRYPSFNDALEFAFFHEGDDPDLCIPWSLVKPGFRLYGDGHTHCFPLAMPSFPYSFSDIRSDSMATRQIGGSTWEKEVKFDREDTILPSTAAPNSKIPLHPGIACFIDMIEEE